jgi:chromosome segregation ATPase
LGIGLIIGGITALIGLVQKLDLSLDGVSKTDKKLLASQQDRLKTSQDQVDALDASDNILKAQGKSEREILQMKIAALKVAIDNQRAVIETSKAQATAQIAAAKRNKDILVGILTFINAPMRGILSMVDMVAEKLGYETGLLSKFDEVIEGLASMAFDPAETKKQADADLKEMQDGLRAMENTMAGHKLAIKAIDANAAKEAKAARDAAAAEQAAKDEEHARKMQQELETQNKERLEALKAQAKEEERIRKEKEEAEAAHQAYLTKLQSDADTYRSKLQFDRLQRDLDGVKRLEEMKAEAVMAGIDLINAVTTNANAQSEEQRKREFKRRQAFDLANTALSTYFAAQKAYESQFLPVADASSPVRATIAAAMAIASGLGRMAAISKQRYQPGAGLQQPGGGGGGGIQRPSLPSSSTLGGGAQMAGQWNNKIYVTEGDITGTQRRVNMLRGASVI